MALPQIYMSLNCFVNSLAAKCISLSDVGILRHKSVDPIEKAPEDRNWVF